MSRQFKTQVKQKKNLKLNVNIRKQKRLCNNNSMPSNVSFLQLLTLHELLFYIVNFSFYYCEHKLKSKLYSYH